MKSFTCKDVGMDCDWRVTGESENDIIDKVRQHGREKHNITQPDENLLTKVKNAIRDVKAA